MYVYKSSPRSIFVIICNEKSCYSENSDSFTIAFFLIPKEYVMSIILILQILPEKRTNNQISSPIIYELT